MFPSVCSFTNAGNDRRELREGATQSVRRTGFLSLGISPCGDRYLVRLPKRTA